MRRRFAERLRKTDPEFAADCMEAIAIAIDRLEEEAWRRGIDGDEEYIVRGGQIVLGPDDEPLTVRKRSDPILLMLLRIYCLGRAEDKPSPIDVEGAKKKLMRVIEKHLADERK